MAPGRILDSGQPEASPEIAQPPQPLDVLPSATSLPQVTQEHPRADEIRRQVEFYFGDANLPNDTHLLELCQGIKNTPVSIKKICGFKKMRAFKPYTQVVAALKQSAYLDVSEDGKRISRKLPLRPWQLAGLDEDGDSDLGAEEEEVVVVQKPAPQPEKKFEPVKSTNPNMTKNLLKPSGFEEFYAEGPLTPAEYQDDLALFDPSCSFSERMESAIQRFKVKKKMHQEYQRVFSAFMKYGGIEIRSQFSGIDPKELKEKDTYEQTRIMATHFVSQDKDDDELWAVDFVAVASGFLASQFPILYGDYSEEDVKRATQVLRMFYNYVMHHNACPEHTDQILAARKICDMADEQLPKVQTAGYAFPGAFNVACSVLFGGYYRGKYIGDQSWALNDADQTANPQLFEYVRWTPGQGFSEKEARIVLQIGVIAIGDDDQIEQLIKDTEDFPNLPRLDEEDLGLEVIGFERAMPDVLKFYDDHNKEFMHKLEMRPLGKLVCKPWAIVDFTPVDVSAETARKSVLDLDRTFEFWVEDDIVKNCFVGMKMEATIWKVKLGKGIWILDTVKEVTCSFFEWLPNELIMGNRKILREPQWLPHGKGGAPALEDAEAVPGHAGDDKETQPARESNDQSIEER